MILDSSARSLIEGDYLNQVLGYVFALLEREQYTLKPFNELYPDSKPTPQILEELNH